MICSIADHLAFPLHLLFIGCIVEHLQLVPSVTLLLLLLQPFLGQKSGGSGFRPGFTAGVMRLQSSSNRYKCCTGSSVLLAVLNCTARMMLSFPQYTWLFMAIGHVPSEEFPNYTITIMSFSHSARDWWFPSLWSFPRSGWSWRFACTRPFWFVGRRYICATHFFWLTGWWCSIFVRPFTGPVWSCACACS